MNIMFSDLCGHHHRINFINDPMVHNMQYPFIAGKSDGNDR